MALSSRRLLLLGLLLPALLCTLQVQGSENTVLDCCHGTMTTPFPAKQAYRLRTYRIQGPQMGCHVPAIVLITKKGRELCAPPDAAWALDLKRRLDGRAARRMLQRAAGGSPA